MEKHDIRTIVERVVKRYQELSTQCDALNAILKLDYNSPMMREIWFTFQDYVSLASEAIDDQYEDLAWYLWDNDCGKQEHKVSVGKGKFYHIRNGNDFVKLLERKAEFRRKHKL